MTETKVIPNSESVENPNESDKDKAERLLNEFSDLLNEMPDQKKMYKLHREITGALNVGIGDFFQREAFRGLRQLGGIDCEIFMIPSYDKKDISDLKNKVNMQEFDFRVTASGKVFNLKIMIQENSPCSMLLCEDFVNKIIWSINSHQSYKKFDTVEIKEESTNYTYFVEIKGRGTEIMILNIQEKR